MWRSAIIVFAFSVALYAKTIAYDFVWDDFTLIVKNPDVHSPTSKTPVDIFTQGFAHVEGRGSAYYRPLTTLSYVIDYRCLYGRTRGARANLRNGGSLRGGAAAGRTSASTRARQ